jgi:hypothetical protein
MTKPAMRNPATLAPSPLAGEGGRRPDEGASRSDFLTSALCVRVALAREKPLIPGLRPDLLPQGEKGRGGCVHALSGIANPATLAPSPLAGEGGRRPEEGASRSDFLTSALCVRFALTREKPLIPGLWPDLLPQGEKGRGGGVHALSGIANPATLAPSPLAGEGGRRPDEGASRSDFLTSAPFARFALARETPLIPGLWPDLLPQGEKGRGIVPRSDRGRAAS